MFTARLTPLAKAIVKAEAEFLSSAEQHSVSEATVIERWAYEHCTSPEAKRLLIEEAVTALGDPAFRHALDDAGVAEVSRALDKVRERLAGKTKR